MPAVHVSMAIAPYHHCTDLVTGRVAVEGAELTVLQGPVEATLQRFARHRHVDVSEYSLAQFVALRSRGDTSLVGLPVFPSRVFRHSSIYVTDPEITTAEQLAGRRIGVPEWAQTAGVWMRGILADDYGLDLGSVQWVQGGVNTLGRPEGSGSHPPSAWQLSRRADAALDDLLQRGEIDAIISARPPRSFAVPDAPTRRLFGDSRAVELDYWRKTEIMPMMHVVVMRADVHERHPWLASSLLAAFEQAKNNAEGQLLEEPVSLVAFPWLPEAIADLRDNFATRSWWPYGVEKNRAALEVFLRYATEQGLTQQVVQVDDLFAPTTVDSRIFV